MVKRSAPVRNIGEVPGVIFREGLGEAGGMTMRALGGNSRLCVEKGV